MSLIVIEGLDGSGKATQTGLLYEALSKEHAIRKISFPDYDEPSSALVKLYLSGAFGEDPNAVNPFAASSFYAVDRYASYKKHWEADYRAGVTILADRYTTSNMIYQAEKVPPAKRAAFIRWIRVFEYGKLGLPKPDLVLYLDMLPEISQKLISGRYKGDEAQKDIHERNLTFLKKCRENALFAAKEDDWRIIRCYEGEDPLPLETIHASILSTVSEALF